MSEAHESAQPINDHEALAFIDRVRSLLPPVEPSTIDLSQTLPDFTDDEPTVAFQSNTTFVLDGKKITLNETDVDGYHVISADVKSEAIDEHNGRPVVISNSYSINVTDLEASKTSFKKYADEPETSTAMLRELISSTSFEMQHGFDIFSHNDFNEVMGLLTSCADQKDVNNDLT